MKTLTRDQWVSAAVGVACASLGVIRRSDFVKDRERLTTIATAAAAGHRIGAVVGRSFMGPAGHVVGMACGCAVGILIASRKPRTVEPIEYQKAA